MTSSIRRTSIQRQTSNRSNNSKPSSSSFIPLNNKETFKDLLVFEERLKQNSERLQRQRIKYEAFLFSLIIVTILLAYKSFVAVSPYKLFHYSYVGLLLVAITTLILFFATGMYTDQIAYAYKFIPQTNRALRPFNMFLNTPPTSSPLKLFVSPKEPIESSVPPLVNPRGELLFSSKVSHQFIDGYEKYRTEWERRRMKDQIVHHHHHHLIKSNGTGQSLKKKIESMDEKKSLRSISRDSTPDLLIDETVSNDDDSTTQLLSSPTELSLNSLPDCDMDMDVDVDVDGAVDGDGDGDGEWSTVRR
ncbi:Spo7-like protein-domain-containing protein [Melampsora americana]|nr:Spo7-like protein-domain-containing protein [Melampsora americana]